MTVAISSLKTLAGKLWQFALRRHPGDGFHQAADPGGLHGQVGQAGGEGRQVRKAVHKPEEVVLQRVRTALVMVAQKFGLPGRHVDVDRALCLACLTG